MSNLPPRYTPILTFPLAGEGTKEGSYAFHNSETNSVSI